MGKYVWSLIATVFQKWKTFQSYAPLRPLTHIHRKSGSIKETVQDRDIDTTEASYGLSIRAISNNLEWPWRSFACCMTYQMQFDEHLCDISLGFNWHGASRGPSAIAELLVSNTGHHYEAFSTSRDSTERRKISRSSHYHVGERETMTLLVLTSVFDITDRKSL